MIYIASFLIGWAIGAVLTGLFVAAATRKPSPEPWSRLERLADLARHA